MARTPAHTSRVHAEPRISANDLARFMMATDTGRIGIIRRAKESVTPVRARYKDAREASRAYLADPSRSMRILDTARATLEQRGRDTSLTSFAREDAMLSGDALAALGRMRNQLGGLNFVPAPRRQPLLALGGVQVSVNLDLLLTRDRGDVEEVGGALIRLTKADEETESAISRRRDMGIYSATLVHMQVRNNLAGNRQAAPQLCMSIDVQSEDIHFAPRAYAQRAANLENACRFIAAMWESA